MVTGKSMTRTALVMALGLTLGHLIGCNNEDKPTSQNQLPLNELGERLFNDTNLSLTKNQACASCHNKNQAFIDTRSTELNLNGAVSIGDDGQSLGTRNSPTLSYAQLSPAFGLLNGEYVGGQFHDGRASHLRAQVNSGGGPFLNPVEMMMPSKAAVVERIQQDNYYVNTFTQLYGNRVFNFADQAFSKIGYAIEAYEMTEEFAPFDSKYDRSVTGNYTLSASEQAGKTLFEANCMTCHNSSQFTDTAQQTFTNYHYYNLGVPFNQAVRNAINNQAKDPGLMGNPAVGDNRTDLAGKFKTPTLRNVAVTAPYMHNGVLNTLDGVIKLHLYRAGHSSFETNPETSSAWGDTDYPLNISTSALTGISVLNQAEIDEIIAFLYILTDARYESLLSP